MREELYSILAMGMRYVFSGLALIIVFRAWRITVVDNRRANILRMIMPDVASVGEFIAKGEIKKRRRKRYLLPREGVLGASGGADVSIKHPDVKRKHAFFELREGGLLIRPLKGARITLENGANAQQLILRDGDSVMLGNLKLTLVLFDTTGKLREEAKVVPDEGGRPFGARGNVNPLPVDDFFEEEDTWQDNPAKKKTRKR